MKAGIGFIIIGGFFVISLLMALVEILFKTDWDKEQFTGKKIFGILKWTIIGLIALILFIWALNAGLIE